MDVFAEDGAVLLGEVDVLEEAMGGFDSAGCYEEPAGQAVFVERNDFARLDFADESGVNRIEGAGFACDDVAAGTGLPYAEGPNAVRVAGGLNPVGEKE